MTARWMLRDPVSLWRAAKLRWQTRDGFTVSDVPAFDPETERWFRERIQNVSHYVEYGSGASTILAARQGIRTVSMESDPRYAQAVRKALPGGAPVTLLDARLGLTEYWGYPVATRPTPRRLERWTNYACQPLAIAAAQGWMPELVLIDGRFRRACALAAVKAAQQSKAPMDILFDDYAGRPYYRSIEDYLGKPAMVGRAALFVVDPHIEKTDKEISESEIAEAARDFR